MRLRHLCGLLITLASVSIITGCANVFKTEYFGVESKAILTPPEFTQAADEIEKAKEFAASEYAKMKIDQAMEKGKEASTAYWECYDEPAKALLALARRSAQESRMYHPPSLPPPASRLERTAPLPELPEKIPFPPPIEGISATCPRMVIQSVYFDFNSTKLEKTEKAKIDKILPLLSSAPNDLIFEIAGNTDSLGRDSYNQRLSEKRARAVRNYLIKKGISTEHIFMTGYGESFPEGKNDSEKGRAENRRVDIRILVPLIPRARLTTLNSLPPGTLLERIRFNTGKTRLLPVYKALIDRLVPAIKRSASVKIEVAGYTDATGSPRLNKRLSMKRARQVASYLTSRGIPKSRIKIVAYGPKDPAAPNDDSRGRAENRRVEIRIAK